MERKDLVRSINTAEIISAVYPNGISAPLNTLPAFNSNVENDANWYRLKEANDGDCLYWCILQALEDNNIFHQITNIADLRMHLFEYLESNPDLVPDWIRDYISQGLVNGVHFPNNEENWGNEHTFPIITNLYNIHIYIYNIQTDTWEESAPAHPNQDTMNLFLEFTGSHYNILLPRSPAFSIIKPSDDDYFTYVDRIELIPEIKRFIRLSHIRSVKDAWDFFQKYNLRNHEQAAQAYDMRQQLSEDEMDAYFKNPPYPTIELLKTPKTTRPLPKPGDDRIHSAGGKLKKRTSKKRNLQRRKSRKIL